jgi:hypothetical protein
MPHELSIGGLSVAEVEEGWARAQHVLRGPWVIGARARRACIGDCVEERRWLRQLAAADAIQTHQVKAFQRQSPYA